MEQQYFSLVTAIIMLTAIGVFGFIKGCDWLIGLKYKTKDDCSATRHAWEKQLREEFAKKETVVNLKEDMAEMKDKINDIHKIVLNLAMKDNEK